MSGEISTFAFDDINTDYATSADVSLQIISCFLYSLHDDLVDHPIAVSPEGWDALRRVVAFLTTDLEAETSIRNVAWPFSSKTVWSTHEHAVNGSRIPTYDPAIHCQQIHSWWHWIPSHIGFAIIAGIVFAILLIVSQL